MPAGGFGAVLGFEAIAAGEIACLIPVAGEDAGLVHGERVGSEVHILPLEGQRFSHPKTGVQNQQVGVGVVIQGFAVFIGAAQFLFEDVHLCRRQRQNLLRSFTGGGQNYTQARVAGEDPGDHGMPVAGVQGVVDLLDAGVGEPALPVEEVDKSLHVLLGDLIELLLP